MKKIYFGTLLIMMSLLTNAQDYSRWSIDLGGGIQQAGSPVGEGYNTSTFGQGSFGVRYMLNERFGVRLDLGYNSINGAEEKSLPFTSNYYRANIEGVINLGNILKFNSWTNRFNILTDIGVGVASLNVTEPIDNGGDFIFSLNFGLTPQYKLSDRFALFLDFSTFINFSQKDNFDGSPNIDLRESNASLFNTSLGLSIALGKNKKLAEFSEEKTEKSIVNDELEILKTRLSSAEKEIAMLKAQETSSPNQELIMTELDERYVRKNETNKYANTVTGSNVDFIRNLLNSGYINVYFDTNRAKIQDGSLNSVNYLKQFMLDNPYVNAELIGYADETGTEENNIKLSQSRAQTVFDVLVAAGIKPSRLSYFGGGEDKTVTKGARQLARKVTFKLK